MAKRDRSKQDSDSGDMPGYFGILNKDGQFWSHSSFPSAEHARSYIREFWSDNIESRDWCLKHFTIVPVRVKLAIRMVEAA